MAFAKTICTMAFAERIFTMAFTERIFTVAFTKSLYLVFTKRIFTVAFTEKIFTMAFATKVFERKGQRKASRNVRTHRSRQILSAHCVVMSIDTTKANRQGIIILSINPTIILRQTIAAPPTSVARDLPVARRAPGRVLKIGGVALNRRLRGGELHVPEKKPEHVLGNRQNLPIN